jgi:SAM-dependent methyltransferase
VRIGAVPDNLIERILLATNLLPTPLLDTELAYFLARTVMVGAKLGVFEALEAGPLTSAEVAAQCQTHPYATTKLLNGLVGARYLRVKGERYALAPVARKWLLRDARQSVYDMLMFNFACWEMAEHFEAYVRSGEPIDIHETLSDEDWGFYQRGMRATTGFQVPEVLRRTPVPKGARHMLDIGGSHGYFSVAFCRRYPQMRAVVMDLPEAVKQAAPILAKEGMGDRVVHRAGDALTDDLGTEAWDLIFMSQLLHHFDEASNRDLVRRAALALRPGGILAIQDVLRPSGRDNGAVLLGDLFFATTSQAGTWSLAEMADWQRAAGLVPKKPVRFLSLPGGGQQSAMKPR